MKHTRLPKYIKPERYQLTIKPDLEKSVFEGEEVIYLTLEKSVSEIILHSKELKVSSVGFFHPLLTSPLKGEEPEYNIKTETISLSFPKKLPKGKGELRLKFKGILNNKMRGFYRSQYKHKNEIKHIATTQFEATDARQAFPCFDEPAKKAIFDVTLMIPKNLTAISNTVETSILEHQGGYKAVKFAPSPKMSTYLVAFIVGDFEFIEGKTKRGVVVRVFVTQGKKHQAKFALDTAVKVLDFYEKYFGINYPLPILDMIAIPDFSHGAMENWGAVTYRESALLVDEQNSSASNKQWVALVIAHELAHQWFGNLVTMEWWTDLWLNEGFASYIEYLAVDHIFPKWDIWTQFAYNDLGVALKLDALNSTHPIEVKVNHPDEIGEIFDEISYSKGASIIRMLAEYIGQDNFRKGLSAYLKKHAFANAETLNLWQAFEKVSKLPVRKIMQAWTSKGGYPVIKVVQKPTGLELHQTRFFSSPISKAKSQDKTLWSIPIGSLNLDTGKKSKFLLNEKYYHTTEYDSISPLKINAGESGFYRVDYPSQMLQALHKFIKNKQLPPIDRLGIIRDAFAMAESGNLPTEQVLNLVSRYKNETDYTVWVELTAGLQTLNNLLFGTPVYGRYKNFCQTLYINIVNKLGWQVNLAEAHTKSLLRSLILHSAGSFGHKPTITEAQKLFTRWMKSNQPVPANLRGVVYNLVAENGDTKEHKFLINKYISENLHEEKNRLGRALGQFRQQNLLKKTLKFALSPHVRIQDTAGLFNAVWANPFGKQLVFAFTKQNWKILLERYPSSGHMLSRFIKPMSYFSTKHQAIEVKKFFKTHRAPGAKRAVEQVLEKIYSNIAWYNRDIKNLQNEFFN